MITVLHIYRNPYTVYKAGTYIYCICSRLSSLRCENIVSIYYMKKVYYLKPSLVMKPFKTCFFSKRTDKLKTKFMLLINVTLFMKYDFFVVYSDKK